MATKRALEVLDDLMQADEISQSAAKKLRNALEESTTGQEMQRQELLAVRGTQGAAGPAGPAANVDSASITTIPEEPEQQQQQKEEEHAPMAKVPLTVAFLGPVASYTHQAALNMFPEIPTGGEAGSDSNKYEIEPVVTIKDVFAAVQDGRADYGVVPFENSSNGSVAFTLDLFADLGGRYPTIEVCGETYVPVQHCLLGRRAVPTADEAARKKLPLYHGDGETDYLDDSHSSGRVTPTPARPVPGKPRARLAHDVRHVRRLVSHPQAWGQCRHFLDYYFKGVEQQDASSTSRAAELVAADESGATAAISSRIAADVHGLDLLAEGIQDVEDNATRFLVIRRRKEGVTEDQGKTSGDDDRDGLKRYKSLIAFTVSHQLPGALVDSLVIFKKHNLNLTSIPTRPAREGWHYIFFVECNGKKRRDGAGGVVNDVIADLKTVTQSHRFLGSWLNPLATR